jgi:hypothetical protein
VKPLIIEGYATHVGYVVLSDKMANSCSISKKTWKWTKKFSLYLLDLSILNSYIFYKSCGANKTDLKFREQLVRNRAVLFHEESTEIRGVPWGRPSSLEIQMTQLEVKPTLWWPAK